MMKLREKHNRVCHLISRIARRAFFLDAYGAVRDGGHRVRHDCHSKLPQ